MKNLHKILPSLTDQELSVLYWAEKRRSGQYNFTIRDGLLYYRYLNSSFKLVTSNWDLKTTLNYWNSAGRPLPDMSVISK